MGELVILCCRVRLRNQDGIRMQHQSSKQLAICEVNGHDDVGPLLVDQEWVIGIDLHLHAVILQVLRGSARHDRECLAVDCSQQERTGRISTNSIPKRVLLASDDPKYVVLGLRAQIDLVPPGNSQFCHSGQVRTAQDSVCHREYWRAHTTWSHLNISNTFTPLTCFVVTISFM
jgi:hypothetical protein